MTNHLMGESSTSFTKTTTPFSSNENLVDTKNVGKRYVILNGTMLLQDRSVLSVPKGQLQARTSKLYSATPRR